MNKPEKQVIKFQLDKEQAAINDLERQYKQALRDIDEKIKLLQSDELTQSRVYQIQYQKALKGQVEGILDKLHGDEYATIQQYLHDSYQDGYIGTMYSIHGQGIPLIVPLDQDAAVKAVITDSKLQEGLYDELGVNIKQLKQAIRQEITRGIASNMPFADIARNIANRSKAPMSRAKTIVRTEGHRIQQASAEDARQAAKNRGCDVVRQWDSTLDGDTRSTHRRLDGKIVELEEYFVLSSTKKAKYPGDFGKPEEDCNCRCVALTRAKWALDDDELKQLKERAAYWKLDKKDDFKAFEERYLKASEALKKQEENDIIEVGKCKDFDELADYLGSIYGITMDDSVKTLDYGSVQSAFVGVESMLTEVPDLQLLIDSVKTTNKGFMSCGYGGGISFNVKDFANAEALEAIFKRNIASGYWIKGSSPASVGAHEASHLIERLLIEKSGKYATHSARVEAWNKCTEAKAVVSQACKNIKKTLFGEGKKNAELLATISGYAGDNASEALADSFESIYIHGEKASPLAHEIKRLALETLKTYKNGR